MSLDLNSPTVDVLGKVGAFGNPYHGKVQGGSMTLPNATTKTWPQPDSTYFDTAGSTHLLMRPGQPAVTRTTEQAAADTADGLQWRNKAMLSGGRFQLYSQELDGWIYIDPTGGRWLIEFTTPIDTIFLAFTTPISLPMRVTRFGSFGGDAETFTTTLGLTDWGQSGYTAFRDFPSDSPPVNVTAADFFLEAVTPSGSKAAICVHQLRTVSALTADPTIDVAVRHPLGWLEISVAMVAGLPELTLSVLKNQAQTLLVHQNSTTATLNADIAGAALVAGGGTTTIRTGVQLSLIELERLVALWVDPATEGWRWVSLRYSYELVTESSSLGASGTVYTAQQDSTGLEFVALEVDGVEQSRAQVSSVSTETMTATYTGTSPDVRIELQRQPRTTTITIEGVDYTEVGAAGSVVVGDAGGPAILNISNFTSSGTVPFGPTADFISAAFRMQWRLQTRLVLPSPDGIRVDLCRQSGQVLCQRFHLETATDDDFTYLQRVTPTGLSGSEITQPYSATERFYGSWCPHTGGVASMEATPVCWV